jgi:hypothetical protein
MSFNYVISTDGKGEWSKVAKEVHIIDSIIENEHELRIYFDTQTWNVKSDGLIYSDPKFLKGVRKNFSLNGFSDTAVASVEYSEHGMQGDTYVSMDFGKVFLKEWKINV